MNSHEVSDHPIRLADPKTCPKIVHYCWFGGATKPASVVNRIAEWKEYLKDYIFIEWNEENFDCYSSKYVAEAYKAQKFAYVSDCARLYALYSTGGIYVDTDVEVLQPFNQLLGSETVLGFEEGNYVATSTIIAPMGCPLIKSLLEEYQTIEFRTDDGAMDLTTNVQRTTDFLTRLGLRTDGSEQVLHFRGRTIKVLDQRKFSPYDYINRINNSDATTFTLHHFEQSWASPWGKIRKLFKRMFLTVFGVQVWKYMKSIVNRP